MGKTHRLLLFECLKPLDVNSGRVSCGDGLELEEVLLVCRAEKSCKHCKLACGTLLESQGYFYKMFMLFR